MKEAYTQNKVGLINCGYSDPTLKRLEKDRRIAVLMNRVHRAFAKRPKELEYRMIKFAEKFLRDNI